MRSSAARARRRHRAPSWWCCLDDEGDMVTVAQLLKENQGLLGQYWLARSQRGHVRGPRRVVVVPRPRIAQHDELVTAPGGGEPG